MPRVTDSTLSSFHSLPLSPPRYVHVSVWPLLASSVTTADANPDSTKATMILPPSLVTAKAWSETAPSEAGPPPTSVQVSELSSNRFTCARPDGVELESG